jgi:heme A synthase
MAFFSTVIWLAAALRPAQLPRAAPAPRALVGAAAATTYLQIVVGAFVRHTGAGMACTDRLPLCDGAWWPAFGPAQLHMAHRFVGVALAGLVVAAAWAPARHAARAGNRFRLALAAAAPALVLAQLGLGLLVVATFISIPVVTLHLAAGALLLADLVALFLALGPAPTAAAARAERVSGLAPAAG